MGKLTCAVMVGFLALHIAEILIILAIATPEWTQKDGYKNATTNHTSPLPIGGNSTEKPNKGLWEFCVENKNCSKLNETNQPAWFKSVQGLDVAGVTLATLALLITYAMLLTERCKKSPRAAILNTAVQLLAATCLLTALIIFSVKAKNNDDSGDWEENAALQFGWSFYVDIAGVVLMWISALSTVQTTFVYSARREGYENI